MWDIQLWRSERPVQVLAILTVLNDLCGWLLHCKTFFDDFLRRFVSTVVCSACSRGDLPLALMISASEVPIGFTTSRGHCHSRSVLALG